jgi:hypothetical protein
MVILSHAYWQRRYGGQDVINQRLAAGGPQGLQIVGVLAPGFELLFPPADNMEALPDVWIANRLTYNNANRKRMACADRPPCRASRSRSAGSRRAGRHGDPPGLPITAPATSTRAWSR